MLEWINRPEGAVQRLGILPGAFNPPTRAHVALAERALALVDQVLLVLPRAFPHKQYEAATADHRAEMLLRVVSRRERLGAAFSDGGLFIDIVRETRLHYPRAEIFVICGRDAAERIVGWDYGKPGAVQSMLTEFRLLVAPREGNYVPPPEVAHAVQALEAGGWDECSSTRIRGGTEGWESLVPEEIADIVGRLYPAGSTRPRRRRPEMP